MLRACVVSSELRTRVDAGGGGGDCEALRASGLCGFGLNWVAEGETRGLFFSVSWIEFAR